MLDLPNFPWDSLASFKARASAFSDPGLGTPAGSGIVDLSVGTPVDPTPAVVRDALCAAANAPGYPQTWGTPDLRETIAMWFRVRRGVPDVDPAAVLPTIGSKELVAWLPTLLGLGAGDAVAFPRIAYPTYDIGARLAGCTPVAVDPAAGLAWPHRASAPRLLWLNSPSNPTGEVLGVGELRRVVDWARRHRVVVASDECYAEFDWRSESDRGGPDEPPTTPSVLDPRVSGESHEGLLAIYSLSKESNLAGYRGAFVAGDPALVRRLLEVRKHAGMMVPIPVQRAMLAALTDSAHVQEQRARYAARRAILKPAVEDFGLRVDGSEAGLYLWAHADVDAWVSVERLADRGILVAPGSFYGSAGERHVRIALTATDERIDAAAARLAR